MGAASVRFKAAVRNKILGYTHPRQERNEPNQQPNRSSPHNSEMPYAWLEKLGIQVARQRVSNIRIFAQYAGNLRQTALTFWLRTSTALSAAPAHYHGLIPEGASEPFRFVWHS